MTRHTDRSVLRGTRSNRPPKPPPNYNFPLIQSSWIWARLLHSPQIALIRKQPKIKTERPEKAVAGAGSGGAEPWVGLQGRGPNFPALLGCGGHRAGKEDPSQRRHSPLLAVGLILPPRGSQCSPPAEIPNLWSWRLGWDQGKVSIFRLSPSQVTPLCPLSRWGTPRHPSPSADSPLSSPFPGSAGITWICQALCVPMWGQKPSCGYRGGPRNA